MVQFLLELELATLEEDARNLTAVRRKLLVRVRAAIVDVAGLCRKELRVFVMKTS